MDTFAYVKIMQIFYHERKVFLGCKALKEAVTSLSTHNNLPFPLDSQSHATFALEMLFFNQLREYTQLDLSLCHSYN